MHTYRIILFCAIWSYLVRLFGTIFTPIVVILIDLIPKTSIRLGSLPLLPHKLKRLKGIPILSSNQICDDYCDWSGNTGMAMHEDIALLFPFLIDPGDCIIEVLDDGVFKDVSNGQDFMAIDDGIDRNSYVRDKLL